MAQKTLDGMRVAILATDGFEQAELEEPRRALEAAGAKTLLVSPKGGTLQGMHHNDKGSEFAVDMEMEEAEPEHFDAVLLPGGALNATICASMRTPSDSYKRWIDPKSPSR